MKAAVLRRPGGPLSIERVDLAGPLAGEVLVRIRATGVCHSDLSVVRGKVAVDLPLVPGHEAAGVVERVGAEIEGVRPGTAWCCAGRPPAGAASIANGRCRRCAPSTAGRRRTGTCGTAARG